MTRSLSLHNIYVEGDGDVAVLSRWFPRLQFRAAGGKDQVRKKVRQDPESCGLSDRDFSTDEEVHASREADSRVVITRRYTIENYLLEPATIAAAVKRLVSFIDDEEIPAWREEAFVQQKIQEWAEELALYAAANSIISEWRNTITLDRELGFLQYLGPLPPIPYAQVVESLRRRLAALTPAEQIEAVLDPRYDKVRTDLISWDGLQRWVHGKILLEGYLFPRVFEPVGFSQARLRDLLIEVGREHIPSELRELHERWTS
jgi:hypothetical protein